MVVSISDNKATIQKFRGQQFMSKQYILPINRLYAMTPGSTEVTTNDSSSSDDSMLSLSSSSDEDDDEVPVQSQPSEGIRRSSLSRRPPRWLASGEWET